MNRGAKIVIVAVVALFALTGIYYAFSSPKPKATASKPDNPGMSAGRISDPIAPGASAPSTLTMGGTTAPAGSAVTPPDNAFAKPTGAANAAAPGTGGPATAGSSAPGSALAGAPGNSLAPAIAGPADPLGARPSSPGSSPAAGNPATAAPTILPPERTVLGPASPSPATSPTITAPTAPKATPPAAKATASAGMTSYTIKSGDTLSTIAGEFYKDTRKWTVIAKANPGLDPARLKVGTVISVPKDGAGSLEARTAPERASASARPTGSSTGTEHTVASGETLSQIAERYLGNKGAWKRIYDANKGVIGSDPAKLKVGTKLVIPAS